VFALRKSNISCSDSTDLLTCLLTETQPHIIIRQMNEAAYTPTSGGWPAVE